MNADAPREALHGREQQPEKDASDAWVRLGEIAASIAGKLCPVDKSPGRRKITTRHHSTKAQYRESPRA
jgi:hypothetical protein